MNKFKEGDLVYIPTMSTSIYTVTPVTPNGILSIKSPKGVYISIAIRDTGYLIADEDSETAIPFIYVTEKNKQC